jgi:hypothetical protein
MSWSKRRGKVCSASENGGGLVSCPEGGTADPDRKPAGGVLYRDKREDRTNRHRPRRGASGRYRNISPELGDFLLLLPFRWREVLHEKIPRGLEDIYPRGEGY